MLFERWTTVPSTLRNWMKLCGKRAGGKYRRRPWTGIRAVGQPSYGWLHRPDNPFPLFFCSPARFNGLFCQLWPVASSARIVLQRCGVNLMSPTEPMSLVARFLGAEDIADTDDRVNELP